MLVKVTPFFKPEDLWIGFYYDKDKKVLYFCPVPCFGSKIELKHGSNGSDVTKR